MTDEIRIQRKIFNKLVTLFRDEERTNVQLRLESYCGVQLVRILDRSKIYMCANCREEFTDEVELEDHIELANC